MSELEDTADHLVVIGRGRLIADTSMLDLLASHGGPRRRLEEVFMELTRDAVDFR
jgi:ABC-2 type transport system ATP-binding protein